MFHTDIKAQVADLNLSGEGVLSGGGEKLSKNALKKKLRMERIAKVCEFRTCWCVFVMFVCLCSCG